MTKTRIFVVDDHALIREGLKRLIEQLPSFEFVGEAADGRAASEHIIDSQAEVAIVDASPELDGAQTTRLLKRLCPSLKVIALAAQEDRTTLRAVFQAGAAGYAVKRASVDELIHAIRTVAAGGVYVDPRLAGSMVSTFLQANPTMQNSGVTLTDREARVLKRISQGYSNKEIAAELGLSVKTVETYKARGMTKLSLRDRVDIVRYATTIGWLREH